MKTIKDFDRGSYSGRTAKKAEEMAKILVRHLRDTIGGDWQYETGYNSWHYFKATLGSISVHYSVHSGNFHAMIDNRKGKAVYGAGIFKVVRNGLPEVAVKEALEFAEKVIDNLVDVIKDTKDKINEV